MRRLDERHEPQRAIRLYRAIVDRSSLRVALGLAELAFEKA
jgi:hypothetical protein